MNKNKSRALSLTLAAMFIALNIVCTRFLAVYTPDKAFRISLQFLPDALCGMILGPVWAMVSCVAADLLGMTLNSAGTMYYPGFTLSAAVQGLLFGLILYKGRKSLKSCLLAVLAVTVVVDAGLNCVWLHDLYGTDWKALFSLRLPILALLFPVKTAVLYGTAKLVYRARLGSATE